MTKYKQDDIVEGLVTGITEYGIFVSLDEYYSGLIHISEISDNYVRDINNFVKVGETIKVKILEVDDNECHVKLSIKNINYRINKRKRSLIEETGSGFKILEDNLDNWINDAILKVKSEKS
jgi:predicted RNA-binding protein with RPS1 domain